MENILTLTYRLSCFNGRLLVCSAQVPSSHLSDSEREARSGAKRQQAWPSMDVQVRQIDSFNDKEGRASVRDKPPQRRQKQSSFDLEHHRETLPKQSQNTSNGCCSYFQHADAVLTACWPTPHPQDWAGPRARPGLNVAQVLLFVLLY